MAEQARGTQIRQAVAAQLRTILVANGYRTDAGADVRVEPTKLDTLQATRITVFPGSKVWPSDAQIKSEREYAFVVEVAVPVSLETPVYECEAVEADCEQALAKLLLPDALPPQFSESVILDRPDGVAAMVLQVMYTTRYR